MPTRADRAEPAEPDQSETAEIGGPGWRSRVVNRSLARATKRSLERGHLFVDATIALLDEAGSTNFTVQEVCDRAGQSLRTFYQHFSGKDDLLLAVYEELFSSLVKRISDEIADLEDPLDRIARSISAAIAHTVSGDGPRRQRDRALAHFRLALTEEHAEDVAAVQVPYIQLVTSLIEDAIGTGALPPQDAAKTAFIISALKTAYLHSVLLGNDVGVDAPTPAELTTFCLRGLGADVTDRKG